ncbi:MAG: hypothetical protein P1U89_00090 [Verrucomicrobiales bacterium]|nr:hypothetical protein [Verrucomicrobiales bacterium]
MKISPSICIDLGAAFTKISIRANPNDTSILLGDPGQVGDYQICIPSLALHRVSTDSWLFGWELLDLDPSSFKNSDDIKIYQNWKKNLFPADQEAAFDIGTDDEISKETKEFLLENDPHQQAITCCREFLTALGQELLPLLINQHPQFKSLTVDKFKTQICVPEFVLNTKSATLIEKIMEEAGFKNKRTFCISEPKSSLIGVLTEGQNYVNGDGTPNINYMFREFELLEKLTSKGEAIFFLDIGAFTTDLALTNLDKRSRKEIREAPAASYPYGIFKLDDMVMAALGVEFRELIRNSEASFRENFHRIAYGGDESDTIILRDGTELDNQLIANCLDEFAAAIIESCESFLSEFRTGDIDIAVMTGGGTVCSRIANRIANGLSQFDIKVIRAHQGANVKNLDPISRELVRGSSAIGGTSILYALR